MRQRVVVGMISGLLAQALSKLIEIAHALKARVQGDDGEFYPRI
jgi:hypothetical protein